MIKQLAFSKIYFFNDHFKMIARDLSKKQALDTIQAIYQINFAGHLENK